MPGWNPINSASTGAGLAGVLAALVIAVSIQIAVTASRDKRDQAMSLKAAPLTLVTLMLAAYLYIVLDGIPNSEEEIGVLAGPVSPATMAADAREYAELAARGFALAGSVLGLGALMTVFMVVASIYDNTAQDAGDQDRESGQHGHITDGEREARAWAHETLVFAAVTIAVILCLGYRVGAMVVGHPAGVGWWIGHVTLLTAPALGTTWAVHRWGPRLTAAGSKTVVKRGRRSAAIGLTATAPAIATLTIITAGPQHASVVDLDVVSSAAAGYYGVGAAVLLALVMRRARISDVARKGALEPQDDVAPDPAGIVNTSVLDGDPIPADPDIGK